MLSRLDAATDYVAKRGGLAPAIERITNKYKSHEEITSDDKLAILKSFESDPKLAQQVVTKDNTITVYRPIRLSENQGRMLCHGNPEKSPWHNGRDVLGFKMENWSDGKLHDVFAVKTDVAKVLAAQTAQETISPTALLAILIGLGAGAALLLAAFFINGPLQKISGVASGRGDRFGKHFVRSRKSDREERLTEAARTG